MGVQFSHAGPFFKWRKATMAVRIELNPYDLIIQAFEKLYPEVDAIIAFSNKVYENNGGMATIAFPKDSSDIEAPVIFIDGRTPVVVSIEMIAHELAHAVLGKEVSDEVCDDESHSEEWNEIFRSIHVEYLRLLAQAMKSSKIFKPEEIDYSTMN